MSRIARRDADTIALYIARDSVSAALNWLERLDEFIVSLRDTPGIGTSREELGVGVRSVAFGQYLVFFRKVTSVLRVLRVIHGSRDWRVAFFGRV